MEALDNLIRILGWTLENLVPNVARIADHAQEQANPVFRPNLRKIDKFDGTKPERLNDFLLEVEADFAMRPDRFPNDMAKLNYVIAHLTGPALRWITPRLADDPVLGLPDTYEELKMELLMVYSTGYNLHSLETKFLSIR
ncbi:hypothetical protein FBU59_003112 [Linderina macrospora]|uniref:Uncharacterized protein n=1 Tax=Linderina macrospora TaxID=4868 RepID=A0ACC1J9E6_9FUNG|nr:hypothetical protein FBU59_003112 [Linderina macrospora]